jgi:hypothetical protein
MRAVSGRAALCAARDCGSDRSRDVSDGTVMRGVIIRDGTEVGGSGGLEFDLQEILDALGEQAATSRWMCRNLRYTSRDEKDVPVLERVASPGASISGAELADGIGGLLLQVIDGEFEGFDSGNQPWAIIRAVDSSWWEVWTDDESARQAIRAKFRVTEEVTADGGTAQPRR